MSRSPLSEITETVSEVVTSVPGVIGEFASTAASRTGDLASTALEKLPDPVRQVVGKPPRKRSKTPWLLLFIAAVTAAGLIWWFRRDSESTTRDAVPDDAPTGRASAQSSA